MDNSLLFSSPKSPFTPRNRFASTGTALSGRKSVQSNLRKNTFPGRYSISGRSTSQVVAKSENYIVESFGLQLPVLINEALTFTDRNVNVSINCSKNGWAWAVCGRRLLIWQYKELSTSSTGADPRTPQRRGTASQCRELTLPHCDIGHKASLVTVFLSEGQQMPSCLSVSPTGDVRYWPSIAHDGSSIDEAGILEGQEFDVLVKLSKHFYILATTTCNLLYLHLQVQGGRHVIVHKTIKPPTGFFGGIGKKFASIIIGMNSNGEKENKLIKICAEKSNKSEWIISVLADRWIQRWLFKSNCHEQFLYEDCDIVRKLRESFHHKLWNFRDVNEVEVWPLDMQTHESNLIILTAALNVHHTPQINFALIEVSEREGSLVVTHFCPMKHSIFYGQDNNKEMEFMDLKFIVHNQIAYVYDEKTIYPIHMYGPLPDEQEKIEFQSQSDRILSATSFNQNNLPLFFSRIFGIVSVAPSDFEPGEFLNMSVASDVFMPPSLGGYGDSSFSIQNSSMGFGGNSEMTFATENNLTVYDLDPEEICNENKDVVSQLKAAFIYHLKRNTAACNGILREIFPDDVTLVESDSILDKTVTRIVKDLAEDIPAADPRWQQEEMTQKQALGSSASLQIIQQLREKSLALNHFIDFLHVTKLWNRLSYVTFKGTLKSTYHVISDIYEKIVAAIALKSIHNHHVKIVDEAIDRTLSTWNQTVDQNLTHQDIFYVRVTQIQDFFKTLVKVTEEAIQKELIATNISNVLLSVDTIILTVLKKILVFRESKRELITPPAEMSQKFEYLPWTATSGKRGLKDIITTLIQLTLRNGARLTGEPEIRQQHYVNLFELVDFYLDGRRNYLESIKDNEKYQTLLHQYESQRAEMINHFVDDEQYELATKLGEKYYDFQALVIICDRTKNQARLDEYIDRFKEQSFSQFAIQWHIKQNKKGDLFERFKRNQADLSRFLSDHPSLAWIQNVFNGKFNIAAQILFEMAMTEIELLGRKKTMLSLSKMAALASQYEMNQTIEDINSNLLLIEHQENLSVAALAAIGYDINNPKVLTPEEIIHLYISNDTDPVSEFEFRKALEILKFVEEPYEMRHKIWCTAILQDTWSHYDVNTPTNALQKLIFFKLVDLCFVLDGNIYETLPSIDDFLRAPELAKLREQKSFLFLLKLGYEYIKESYKTPI